jgi:hypothetical protein
VGRFVEHLEQSRSRDAPKVVNVGGAIGATMSPVYAACARHIVNTTADLIFVDFAVNDLYKSARAL